jgi:hypothetical protein
MRQSHVGGEKVFVDFAGDTIGVTDPDSLRASERKSLRERLGSLAAAA